MNTPRQHGIGDVKMRLIDADALKAKIRKAEKEFRRCKIEPVGYKMAFADGVGAVADLIVDEAPTIEERKHGHWVQVSDWDKNGQAHFDCSVCGAGDVHADDAEVPYCWHCGAVMDEVAEDEVRQNK